MNGYLPTLQTPGQLIRFMQVHLGQAIASPAALRPLHDRLVEGVEAFARRHRVPVVHFERGERKDDIANAHRSRFGAREGVVLIGVAQERAWSFKSTKRRGDRNPAMVFFDFSRQPVFVKHYYFYVQDPQWGPAFIKIGSYVPYPVKLCLNGHEWVKQQLRRKHIGFVYGPGLRLVECLVECLSLRITDARALGPRRRLAVLLAGLVCK